MAQTENILIDREVPALRNTVTIDTSRPLRLLQLSDLHLGLRFDQKYCRLTEKLVRDAIEGTKPDIIVITGDLAWCPETVLIYSNFCAMMDSYNIPWCFCFGNHDRDYVKDPRALELVLENSATCLYHNSDESVFGYGNYFIRLVDGEGKLVHLLYFFDNAWPHRYDGLSGYTCGSLDHNRWFRRSYAELSRDRTDFNVWAFVHIPLPEFENAWNEGGCVGSKNGKNASARINTGLFCTLAENKHVKGIFCGHDHGTNYMGEHLGVKVIFGRTTGFNQSKLGITTTPCGARVCDISPDGSFSTFFFMEDGTLRNANDEPIQ